MSVGETRQKVGDSMSTSPVERPDEDTWVVPAAWWRKVEPFRGRSPVRPVALDDDATESVERFLRERGIYLTRALENPESEPELVQRAESYVAGTLDPLGAAIVAIVVGLSPYAHDRPSVVDHWVERHGLGFAAEAAVLLAAVQYVGSNSRHGNSDSLQWRPPGQFDDSHTSAFLRARVRSLLACSDESTYTDAVARLGALRGHSAVDAAIAYVVPTEQHWVADIVDRIAAAGASGQDLGPLLASVTKAEHAARIVTASTTWSLTRNMRLAYSAAAYVGPGFAPVAMQVFDREYVGADDLRPVADIVAQMPGDPAFQALLNRLENKYVQPAVLDALSRFPRRAMRMLAVAAAGTGAPARAAGEVLRMHVRADPQLATETVALLQPGAARVLQGITDAIPNVPIAAPDQLPSLLATPPWTGSKTRAKPVVIDGIATAQPVRLEWLSGEQERWAKTPVDPYEPINGDWQRGVDNAFSLDEFSSRASNICSLAPDELVRPHLRTWRTAYAGDATPQLTRLLGRFDEDAIEFVVAAVALNPNSQARVLLPLTGSAIAATMASWLSSKSIQRVAIDWFSRHPAAAARDLIPDAVGKAGTARNVATAALALIVRQGNRSDVLAAASEYGVEVAAAVEAIVDVDPLVAALPARLPVLPSWLDPANLPPVLLTDRQAVLPVTAAGNLCTMFAMSTLDDVYVGIEPACAALDPGSLAEFAWEMFTAWRLAGYPSKQGWILTTLGVVGDDETVRRLAPMIRAWPGEAAHKRAVTGLDVLAAIGTDVALMHLHGIAEKVKFKALKTQAQNKIAEVAENLGLTPDELADRLVPNFGLDETDSLLLDYGPRRFRIGFDEQLRPTIADEDGTPRKTLPKPGAKDDADLGAAAYAHFAGLKKDLKTVAADQVQRFEKAMVSGRRWPAAQHRKLFVEHPLLWHLVRRLVWATYDDNGEVTASFRIAEDRTLADSSDDAIAFPEEASIGIPHPIHLGDSIATWSDVFADYEILQPFPQLGREVLRLTDEERQSRTLPRFANITVPTGKVLGLERFGWQRGMPQDGGVSVVIFKPIAADRVVVVDLDMGIPAGDAMMWPEQTIPIVWLNDGPTDWGSNVGKLNFELLEPASASEVLRELEGLRTA